MNSQQIIEYLRSARFRLICVKAGVSILGIAAYMTIYYGAVQYMPQIRPRLEERYQVDAQWE